MVVGSIKKSLPVKRIVWDYTTLYETLTTTLQKAAAKWATLRIASDWILYLRFLKVPDAKFD